ncbi:Putative inner membrane protein YabI [Candidatus Providencia siddallii]|uniref:Putative inner membrane protein YabI n=1 Tax=Candidatus Providencia siddallii TaxID=1715285 RepID=A0A0M6W6Q2_9GAMM|nr:Putative inner membrane protein YabI [Candidatus Providencia siddallii]
MNFNKTAIFIFNFYREHEVLVLSIVFFIAFCESLAFLSLLIPATIILFGLGTIIGKTNILFWPFWLVTALGAFFGDWFSYWFGFYYKENIINIWPMIYFTKMINKGHKFFKHWGAYSVFFGRFLGSFRAVIPLIAGICAMPKLYFQILNMASAILWSFIILAPGALGIHWFTNLINF